MSEGNQPNDVFDVERIRQLVELMKDHELSEIDLRYSNQRIRLARGQEGITVSPGSMAVPMPAPVAPAPAPTSSPAATPAPAPAEEGNFEILKSPMVGTYYAKPKPDAAAFVKVGDQVSPDTTVCIIEAMKTFNEITAEYSGTIVEIMVGNGEPVDMNKPLFKIKTS